MMVHIAGYEKIQALYRMKPESDNGTDEFKGIKKSLTFENV